ncbi:MAG: hypothetical protein MRJ65_01890 [Candidatus Brocadiaceae bacterium]|nr:hypothetical protein [Candidatus Brocadiaceae bacterium]
MRKHLLCVWTIVVVLMACSSILATPPAPKGDAQAWDSYWRGLVAMREDKWADAITRFSEAVVRSPGDGRLLLARGVAYALAGDFDRAAGDLARAQIKGSREPQLWKYAVEAMSGKLAEGSGIPIPRSLQKEAGRTVMFSGIPGHMIQGGNDYTTSYASCVYYELAMPYREAREKRGGRLSEEIAAARSKASRWFANRALATPELASRNFACAQQLMRANNLPMARDVLKIARSACPQDADMAAKSGDLWLQAGRPATARRDYTIALTMNTSHAAAYAGRAEAAAMMGDSRRARADLDQVKRLGGAEPAGSRKRIKKYLTGNVEKKDPVSLLNELDKAAIGGATIDELVPLAQRLHRAAAQRDRRYSELYQDQLRVLEESVNVNRKNIDGWVALAQYLVDEANIRGEQVEPRRGLVPFRWQHSQQSELNRALYAVDQALQLDGKHVRGLVVKAYVFDGLGQQDQAEQLLMSAIRIAGSGDAQAVRLLAEYRSRQVGQLLASAMALRTPTYSTSTRTEHRYDGVWEITTTYRRDPTAADLRNADGMERKAAALMQEAKLTMEAAIRATKGTLEGLLLESSFQNWFGTRDKALALLQQAVRDYPELVKAHDALIAYLRYLGRYDEAIEQEAVAWQLFQTTSAPLLRRVWNNVGGLGWASLTEDLQRARRLDPADARGTAYLSAAKANMGQKKEAMAFCHVAAALEQARLLLDEQGVAQSWPRGAGDLALLMQAHHLLAVMANTAGKADAALAHFEASSKLAGRYPVDGIAALMFGAMLPDPNAPTVPAPAPVNGATLAAEGYVGAARALQKRGRTDEAQRYFQAAAAMTRAYGDLTPNVGTGRGDSNFGGLAEGASAEALVELARADIKSRDYKAAFEKLQSATQAKPSRELRGEINRMIMEMLPHLNKQ